VLLQPAMTRSAAKAATRIPALEPMQVLLTPHGTMTRARRAIKRETNKLGQP